MTCTGELTGGGTFTHMPLMWSACVAEGDNEYKYQCVSATKWKRENCNRSFNGKIEAGLKTICTGVCGFAVVEEPKNPIQGDGGGWSGWEPIQEDGGGGGGSDQLVFSWRSGAAPRGWIMAGLLAAVSMALLV